MSLHDRWMAHMKPSTLKRKGTYKIYNAMNKYGKENFMCEILEDNVPIDELNNKEIYYIEKYDSFINGYNSTKGGDGRVINNEYDVEKIVNDYISGKSSSEISKEYGVCSTTIARVLHSKNIKMREDGRKLTVDMLDDIIELASTNTYDKVAEIYNVDPKTIRRFLIKHNFRKRKPYKYQK